MKEVLEREQISSLKNYRQAEFNYSEEGDRNHDDLSLAGKHVPSKSMMTTI